MKILAAASLLTVISIAGARADLTLVQNVEGLGPVSAMTIKIKGDKARIEATPDVTTIVDSKSGEMLNVMNSSKKFIRVTASQAKAVAEMAVQPDQKDAPVVKPQLKATGRKETINGYETDEYVCEAPAFKATYWISTKYPDSAAIVKQLQAMTPQAWGVAGKGMPDYRDFPGLPLRSSILLNGKEIVSTLVSVKQNPLADSEFAVPAGFDEMKMPDLNSLLGGRAGAPKNAPKSKP